MMVISVSLGAQSYPIILDSGVLARAGEHLALARRVLVVTDSGVPEEYAETVAGACRQARICTVPAGESSKNMGSYQHSWGRCWPWAWVAATVWRLWAAVWWEIWRASPPPPI